jgi:sugar lactone lactonase YvrE
MSTPDVVWDAHAYLGEGPLWDDREHVLHWLDVDGRTLFTLRGNEQVTTPMPGRVSSVALRESGGLLAAHDRSISFLEDGELVPVAPDLSPRPRTNDGAVDPAGRYFVGTVAPEDAPGTGALYRLDPDLSVRELARGLHVSNGLDWSRDARTMFYVDSLAHSLDAFDYDVETGEIANRRVIAPIEIGVPDGLTIDADGAIWLAVYGGWCVRRYAPSGELLTEVPFPVSRPTSCIFGGDALDTLYVTSAREGLDDDGLAREPHAGALFAVDVGVRGRPAFRFSA